MSDLDYSTYLSPFTWRYGSEQMRQIFSEQHKYEIWRKIWVNLAQAQFGAGLVSREELEDLKKQQNNIDIKEILEIEKETRHDVVAAIKEFAKKAKIGGGKIHLGATSMDIVDNADSLRIKEALELTENRLVDVLIEFGKQIKNYSELPCMGYTHLQPAEPTTVGYRLAFYAQDLLTDFQFLQFLKSEIKAKGIKGAVGTSASYKAILKNTKISVDGLEKEVMKKLGIDSVLVSSQTSPRKYDYLVINLLTSIGSSLSKFANDVRIMQSPGFGEWQEPFGNKQVGSSAMPFKKNPLNSEKICSLARMLLAFPQVVLENASLSFLERTLDDSANKRIIMSESFLVIDEILQTAEKIIAGLIINKEKVAFNLNQFAPFSSTEVVIIEAVKKGANRQEMHEVLRGYSLAAWDSMQRNQLNPLTDLIINDKKITRYLLKEELKNLFDVSQYIGLAPQRCQKIIQKIKKITT